MKVHLRLCLVLLTAFLLGACYESRVPLASSKDSTIDQNLIGKWRGKLKRAVIQDEVPAELLILQFNHNEYYVKYQVGKSGKVDHHNLRAYIVMVDGVPFINVQNLDSLKEDERTFIFFRYSVSEDSVLTLKMVSDSFVKTNFRTSDKLYKFIEKNLNNEKLYEKPIQFKIYKK